MAVEHKVAGVVLVLVGNLEVHTAGVEQNTGEVAGKPFALR